MKKLSLEIKRKIKLSTLIYSILFVVIYGVTSAKIFGGSLVPFGVGIVFSLLPLNLNGYVLSVIYLLAYTLAGMSMSAFFEGINVSLILSILFFVMKKKKKKLPKYLIFIFAFISQIIFIFTHLGSATQNVALIVIIILSMLFLYSCLVFLDGVINKYGGLSRVTVDEKICGAVILIIFIYGMSSTSISIVNLGLMFSSLIILISTYLLPSSVLIVCALIMGIAYSLCMQMPVYISLFVIMAIVSIAFKSQFKYLSAFSINIVYVLYLVLFNAGISYGEILSVFIGSIVFVLIPLHCIDKNKRYFDNKYNVTVRNILNNTKKQIIKRVEELSGVFNEMNGVYKDMVRGVLSENKAKTMLKEELVNCVCSKCKNFDSCYRMSGSFMDNSISTIIDVAYERGKVLLIDLPQHLSTNCVNVNELIIVINDMVKNYLNYTTAISNMDTSRLLIANQLEGVSKLLSTLSKEVDVNINFDSKFDEKIKEELNFKNIVCYDVAIYEKDIQTKNVNLIVKSDSVNEKIIEKIVSKILNIKLQVNNISPSDFPNASVVSLCRKPNYDVAYGSSTITKAGKIYCGDSKSLIKIDDGKYMVSICDGMGSGEKAYNISALTISLIEKFYLAGFDNETILNSVNKLLSLTEEENFSTIDLCIIDGKKNTYDFIKLGATSGYLKRDNGECEIISSSGLPVGVLEEIRPHIIRKIISPFDMLVFVSDGVTDSFEGKIELAEYIRNCDIINPLTMSKSILNKALELCGGVARDDMTVICVRVFNNV